MYHFNTQAALADSKLDVQYCYLPLTCYSSQEEPIVSNHFCRLALRAIFPAVLFTNQPASTNRTSKLAIWKAARARWRISSVT